jgi:hypothetical protein
MSNKCQFSNLILPNDPLYAVAAGKYIVEIAKNIGFFFAGVMPGGLAAGDALILQYLNNVPIDYEQINITSNIAHQILAHIKSHNPNSE